MEDHNIKLSMNSDTKVSIVADPIRIEQVIINLLTNSINHCSNENIIEFKLFKTTDHKVRVSIYNTGQSIPEDSLKKIWTSFYKVDEARTREYSGSGLGLSIVKNIIEVHHGSLGVNNKEDGVEFWFELDLET
jgi:signal transduction histidine kinase